MYFKKEKEFFCSVNRIKCFLKEQDSLIAFDELQEKEA
jgi:hypothetical protein